MTDGARVILTDDQRLWGVEVPGIDRIVGVREPV